ncbi:CDP-alcohol phosphatidyltransferase family protein [Nocardioides guangzhouensis]|uniref:CDP-alcohol phosphatidyltransferase family protein n=1 Tax=Nocardioides guangzhouensis TaxID=2497878 RepID=A0A4Q4ZLT7_9ACTN|nr:CDP-alcohol phosphatidyltransferase family protein [Nocardioides guangzhouensis]RYP88905.1 CDP-alcohol phosphatidyltransferase family protein [Nocardioides guangzhouensis]
MVTLSPATPVLASAPTLRVGPFATLPNLVTLVRTVTAVTLGVLAEATSSLTLAVVAYAIFWMGDLLDGWSARRLRQETRAGAVFDIVSDRACVAVLCAGLVSMVPGVTPVALVFLLSFMVLDAMLSLSFLCWPVVSPNYFHVVDRRVWQLNWSPAGKAANSAGVIGAVALGLNGVALVVALLVVAVKLWSSVRVVHLIEAHGL